MSYYLASTRCVPAHYQAALLLDYARNRDVDVRQILQGSGLGETEASAAGCLIAPAQYLQLLTRLAVELPERDTSFLLGQQLLPGHLGDVSHAFLQARNLRQALDILVRYQVWLSPLLAPHLLSLSGRTALYWTDSCVSPRLRPFLVEMMMAAVSGACRWLSDTRLPWRFRFNRTRPAHLEQYVVHLGTEVRFDDYFDAMVIDDVWLDRPWPRGSEAAVAAALAEIERRTALDFPRRSLLAALYDYLLAQVRQAPTLERASAAFGVSPATLKRHLAQHGSHFQAELDLVRTHVTLQLLENGACSNEQIAAHLGFHDANNFRRSFKRWTGLTPSSLRLRLLQPSG